VGIPHNDIVKPTLPSRAIVLESESVAVEQTRNSQRPPSMVTKIESLLLNVGDDHVRNRQPPRISTTDNQSAPAPENQNILTALEPARFTSMTADSQGSRRSGLVIANEPTRCSLLAWQILDRSAHHRTSHPSTCYARSSCVPRVQSITSPQSSKGPATAFTELKRFEPITNR